MGLGPFSVWRAARIHAHKLSRWSSCAGSCRLEWWYVTLWSESHAGAPFCWFCGIVNEFCLDKVPYCRGRREDQFSMFWEKTSSVCSSLPPSWAPFLRVVRSVAVGSVGVVMVIKMVGLFGCFLSLQLTKTVFY